MSDKPISPLRQRMIEDLNSSRRSAGLDGPRDCNARGGAWFPIPTKEPLAQFRRSGQTC